MADPVVADKYFAKIFETEYSELTRPIDALRVEPNAKLSSKATEVSAEFAPAEIIGLWATRKERWVRVRCQEDIPALHKLPELPYQRGTAPLRGKMHNCVVCAPTVAKSPNLRGLGVAVV